MKHIVTSCATAVAATALVLGTAGTAHAATVRVNDARADVWKMPSKEGQRPARAGSPLNSDVRRTVVDHSTDTLTVTTTYQRLAKKKSFFQSIHVIRTDAGREYLGFVFAGPRTWRGEHGLMDSSAPRVAMRSLRGTATEECEGTRHRVRYGADTVTLSIPRSCLGDASWVKVKTFSVALARRGEKTWIDNGHNRTRGLRGWSRQVAAELPPAD